MPVASLRRNLFDQHIHDNEECTVEQCVGNYSELLPEHVLSIAETCAYNRQKDLVNASMTSMFCVLWIGGEVAPDFWQRNSRSRVHRFNCSTT